jgi:riboflavin synthase
VFTGIIQAVGSIQDIEPLGEGRRLFIDAGALGLGDVKVGDSIAVNGACMTVISKDATQIAIDVSAESIACTAGLDRKGEVNLEKAMRLGDRVDGHLVSGHVDGRGEVREFHALAESWRLIVRAPVTLAPYLACKGSVAINGVSLTVNEVVDVRDATGTLAGTEVSINLIPHTIAVTTLKSLMIGDLVNLEIDQIARYCERMLALRALTS